MGEEVVVEGRVKWVVWVCVEERSVNEISRCLDTFSVVRGKL